MACVTPVRLAVALEGTGWHPAAGNNPDGSGPGAGPDGPGGPAVLSAGYWTELAQEAERGKLDFVTFEDSLAPGPARLDAALIAARVAPLTSRIGLIPTVTTTHPEPFHISTAIATLDYVSSGRAGWLPRTGSPAEGPHFGRRDGFDPAGLLDEAADVVEVVRRLWDSWQDDAIVRDAGSGRFLDRDKLHYVDFEGRSFSVKGPSITPRPPQGQPVVAALARSAPEYRFAARSADLVLVTPTDEGDARRIVAELRDQEPAPDRSPLRIFADLTVFLDDTEPAARDRKSRLDDRHGSEFTSDAALFVGTPDQLRRRLQTWQRAGIDAFRLRPGALPHDLHQITRGLVPALQENDAFRRGYEARTLRALLGLPRPTNRYQPTP
jgi:alkanesulfonate monooxygenase SsuD/methylene tetrahydromethanopterin reductase-like flavin-dependent oxidoreductase (luciferase family)